MNLSEYLAESVVTGKVNKTLPHYYPTTQDADVLVQELVKIRIPREDYNDTCKKRNTPCYAVMDNQATREYEIAVNLGPKNEVYQFCYNSNKKCLSMYLFDVLRNPSMRVGHITTHRVWGPDMDSAAVEMFNKLLEI